MLQAFRHLSWNFYCLSIQKVWYVSLYMHILYITSISWVKNKQEKYRENGNGLFGNAYR